MRTLLLFGFFFISTFVFSQEVRLQSVKSSGDSLIVLSQDEPAVFNLEDGQMLTIEVVDEEGVRSYPIELKTELPFWQQVEFLWALILLLGIAIYFVFRFSVNRSRKNAVIEAKLAHLERSALQAQMNPHFIFNSLNSIQSYIANNENDKANRFLAKFSRLIRSMLNHARSQKVSLHEEIESLRLYLELEKMRFKDKFDFDIVIDEDIDPSDIELPPLLIQPYLENAIIHGLAQKRSMGKINLFYIMDGKYLLATVTDNGVGYETSKAQKTGQASLHKSVGMTVTQKRLEMLDEGNRDRKVDIKEVKDRFGEVLGTKVEVKIRVH